jgi:SAM-dependent methyltransferase
MRNASPRLFCLAFSVAACFAQESPHTRNLAPYVSSPQRIVERMLEAANLKPGETIYDLGCGDGRFLITAVQKFGAKAAVGVELSKNLVKLVTERIRQSGIENRAKVIHADLLDVDVSPADVVILYLLTDSNELVRPKLEKSLRPGARVVSHDYQVRGWKPNVVEKAQAYNRTHTIYVYQMPPEK